MLARLLTWSQIAVLLLAFALGCHRSPPPPLSDAKPWPTSVTQADDLKKGGASWTNEEIRVYYNKVVATIAAANEQWKKDGLSAEERAHRAFETRHGARLTCRAMMASRDEVDDLRKRDQERYGSPDGPTFEWLVENAKKKGASGDAVFESIIQSAQRTDEKTNAAFGIEKKP